MQMSGLHAMHPHVICQHTVLVPLMTSSLAEVRFCTAMESSAINGGLRMACQAGLLPLQAMECHSTQLWALSCGGQLRSAGMRRRRATWASAWPWGSTRPFQVGAPGQPSKHPCAALLRDCYSGSSSICCSRAFVKSRGSWKLAAVRMPQY